MVLWGLKSAWKSVDLTFMVAHFTAFSKTCVCRSIVNNMLWVRKQSAIPVIKHAQTGLTHVFGWLADQRKCRPRAESPSLPNFSRKIKGDSAHRVVHKLIIILICLWQFISYSGWYSIFICFFCLLNILLYSIDLYSHFFPLLHGACCFSFQFPLKEINLTYMYVQLWTDSWVALD